MNITRSVITYVGGILKISLGVLNEMWLSIAYHSISVNKTAKGYLPTDCLLWCFLINISNDCVALPNFPTSPIFGNISVSQVFVVQ